MMFSGWFDLPWWGVALAALALTHITIAGVTIYLHRCQAHRALDLHPVASHFFRLWMWLTTGQVTKEWAAIHRKHHAKCETAEDPHSPQVYGINRVLWGGVFLYVKESHNKETLERYGHGTPDDWIERNLYTRYSFYGIFFMLAFDLFAFGVVPGALVWITQMAWIPFWAAGVINGVGHFFGYRYDVLSRYAKSLKQTYAHELERLRRWSPRDAEVLSSLRRGLLRGQALAGAEGHKLAEALKNSRALDIALAMRHELIALWERSSASKEQLLRQLQDWCRRAEASGVAPLVAFSERLRSYAVA